MSPSFSSMRDLPQVRMYLKICNSVNESLNQKGTRTSKEKEEVILDYSLENIHRY